MIRLFSGLLFSTLLITGCATNPTLSNETQQSLTTVSVDMPKMADEAYKKPNGSASSAGYGDAIPAATGGGLLPALIGAAIDSSIAASEQEDFEVVNAQYFDAIKSGMPKDVDALIQVRLREAVGNDTFFQSRLRDQSKNRFITQVEEYGLIKADKNPSSSSVKFRIKAVIHLEDQNGEELLKDFYTVSSTQTIPMRNLAQDPTLLRTLANDAADQLGMQMGNYLASITTAK